MAIRVSNVTGQFFLDPNVVIRNVEDTIQLGQETEKRALKVYNVTFQALISTDPAFGRAPVHDLGFVETAGFFHAIDDRQVPSNQLNLQQSIQVDSFPATSNNLVLTQEARPGLFNGIAQTDLYLSQSVHFCFGLEWETQNVQDNLFLIDRAGLGISVSADNTLTLSDEAFKNSGLSHFLNLQQIVTAGLGDTISDTLNLSQTIETESIFSRTHAETSVVKQAFTYYTDGKCVEKTYNKFEGEGTNTETFPDKRLHFDSAFVLETLSGPKQQLVLRSPETDDRDRIGFNRINRETRGGELGVFSDPIWAQVNTLLFTIVALKPDKLSSLQEFFLDTLGQEILLHDWTGSSWRGVVTTPNEVATEDADGWWTISFEFEGEPFDGSAGAQALSIEQSFVVQMDYTRSLTNDVALDQEAIGGGPKPVGPGQATGLENTVTTTLLSPLVSDDFSGGATSLDSVAADTGGDWSANDTFLQDGTLTSPVRSGAYLPFSPESGKTYRCDWSVKNINQRILYEHAFGGAASSIDGVTPDRTFDSNTFHSASNFLADGSISAAAGNTGMYLPFTPSEGTRYVLQGHFRNYASNSEAVQDMFFFFGEGLSSPASDTGTDASGVEDPTTLKAGHIYRGDNTGNNRIQLGNADDGTAASADWTDGTLAADTAGDIDLRVILDTTGGTGNWTASFYSRLAGSNKWTQVGGPESILDENVGAVGVGIGTSLSTDIEYLKLYEDTSVTPNQESRFFLAETYPSSVGAGVDFDGTTGVTSLKTGFVLRESDGVGDNICRLGNANDGEADSTVFSDTDLKEENNEIDLRLQLNFGTSPSATWLAKHPNDSEYTVVKTSTDLFDDTIGSIGMAIDSNDMYFEITNISVAEETTV